MTDEQRSDLTGSDLTGSDLTGSEPAKEPAKEPVEPDRDAASTAADADREPRAEGQPDDVVLDGVDATASPEIGAVTAGGDGSADDGSADDGSADDGDVEAADAEVGRTAATVTATAADARPADDLFGRIVRAFRHPRLSGAGIVIALLVGLLGFALIAQVKSNNSSSTLTNDRPDDLVRILSDLDSRKDRLDKEITNLQTQQQQLSSGAQVQQAALNAATQRADELGILAGTVPAVGPGLAIRMGPESKPISSIVVLETIEELRGAGAEAIEISGTNSPTVRVIASTWFGDGDTGVIVSGTQLSGTLTITAIGDSQTMQTALSIPGGVADTVRGDGGTVLLQPEGRVQVTALAPSGTLKYAHPVP